MRPDRDRASALSLFARGRHIGRRVGDEGRRDAGSRSLVVALARGGAMADHVRRNDGLTAAAERRVLQAIARRLPRWMHSDHLTSIGVAGMTIAATGYAVAPLAAHGLWLATAGLIANWFGDSLDGTLARLRKEERPRYGFYLDHALDTFGTGVLIGGMALGGLLSPPAGLALFSAYVAVCQETALATHALGEFRLAWWRLGPTELRMGLIAANAVAWAAALRGYTVSGAFDAGAWIATVGLAITWTRSVMVHGAALYALEPRPRGGAGRQSAFSSGGSTARNSELNRSVNCPSSAVTRS